MDVHLIDGTYELFRHYYALPSARERDGREVAGVRGVLASILGMIHQGATHVGVATDHVIESFRNRLWTGYKTGAGIEPDLLDQFQLLEDALAAMGIPVWPMVEYEADDALASAAAEAARDPRVDRVIICTPDKDLAQCVRGTRIVQLNRRTRTDPGRGRCCRKVRGAAGVDTRLPGSCGRRGGWLSGPAWAGARNPRLRILARYGHLESIPADWRTWHVNVTRPGVLADTLARERDRVFLFRSLATLRTDMSLFDSVDESASGKAPRPAFAPLRARLDAAVGEQHPVPREGLPAGAWRSRGRTSSGLRVLRRLGERGRFAGQGSARIAAARVSGSGILTARVRPRADGCMSPSIPPHTRRTANFSSSVPAPAEARWPPGWLKPGGA